ncbi:hypothetical protein QBC45DRAFT_441676 [Copromyces sp. CBS 386.78]|nr:hypothetical protein QBC45DRAFT_441676 [Copromyces sp. CBS 386.78]
MSSNSGPQTPLSQGSFPHFNLKFAPLTSPAWVRSDNDMEARFSSFARRPPAEVSRTRPSSPSFTAPAAQTTNSVHSPAHVVPAHGSINPAHSVNPAPLPDPIDEEIAALRGSRSQAQNARFQRMRRAEEQLGYVSPELLEARHMVGQMENEIRRQAGIIANLQREISDIQREIDEREGVPGMEQEIIDRMFTLRFRRRELSEAEELWYGYGSARGFHMSTVERFQLCAVEQATAEKLYRDFKEAKAAAVFGITGHGYFDILG